MTLQSVLMNAQVTETVPAEKVASLVQYSANQVFAEQMEMMLQSVKFLAPVMWDVQVERAALLVSNVQRRRDALRDVRTAIPIHHCHVPTA
eukprot:scaffold32904_cov111-Skeletonema_dohrnii-CCMP3373.AAC.1